MEPRMRVRNKGQQFGTPDLEAFLTAFGSPLPPPPLPHSNTHEPTHLPATITVLDEIITTFIIETCHQAAICASYSHRSKIKVDDFKFALRGDPRKLGRVAELLGLDKEIKKKRKAFDVDEGAVGRGKAGVVEEEDDDEGGKRRGGKGKRRKKGGDVDGATGGT
ncbi:MAG: Transcription initiation factor TFIID subunit 13 [Chrysothrix sp. TS-e1954]|nr:MAG: Transcription initiation factor TFIID subunit 13 [Chrysothrix sp. TS-e1954]